MVNSSSWTPPNSALRRGIGKALRTLWVGALLVPGLVLSAPVFSDRFVVTNALGIKLLDATIFEGAEPAATVLIIPLNVGAAINAGLIDAFALMVEGPRCLGCPPETDPAGKGLPSDLITLEVTRNAAGVPISIELDFISDSDTNSLIPPAGFLGGAPITENGTLQDISLSLFPRYPAAGPLPFKIEVKSCSLPCEADVPEPSTLSLVGLALLTLLRRSVGLGSSSPRRPG